jgi:hypothetical protein
MNPWSSIFPNIQDWLVNDNSSVIKILCIPSAGDDGRSLAKELRQHFNQLVQPLVVAGVERPWLRWLSPKSYQVFEKFTSAVRDCGGNLDNQENDDPMDSRDTTEAKLWKNRAPNLSLFLRTIGPFSNLQQQINHSTSLPISLPPVHAFVDLDMVYKDRVEPICWETIEAMEGLLRAALFRSLLPKDQNNLRVEVSMRKNPGGIHFSWCGAHFKNKFSYDAWISGDEFLELKNILETKYGYKFDVPPNWPLVGSAKTGSRRDTYRLVYAPDLPSQHVKTFREGPTHGLGSPKTPSGGGVLSGLCLQGAQHDDDDDDIIARISDSVPRIGLFVGPSGHNKDCCSHMIKDPRKIPVEEPVTSHGSESMDHQSGQSTSRLWDEILYVPSICEVASVYFSDRLPKDTWQTWVADPLREDLFYALTGDHTDVVDGKEWISSVLENPDIKSSAFDSVAVAVRKLRGDSAVPFNKMTILVDSVRRYLSVLTTLLSRLGRLVWERSSGRSKESYWESRAPYEFCIKSVEEFVRDPETGLSDDRLVYLYQHWLDICWGGSAGFTSDPNTAGEGNDNVDSAIMGIMHLALRTMFGAKIHRGINSASQMSQVNTIIPSVLLKYVASKPDYPELQAVCRFVIDHALPIAYPIHNGSRNVSSRNSCEAAPVIQMYTSEGLWVNYEPKELHSSNS